jgi:hypothetical protein
MSHWNATAIVVLQARTDLGCGVAGEREFEGRRERERASEREREKEREKEREREREIWEGCSEVLDIWHLTLRELVG